MRKLSVLLATLVLLALAIVPTLAQETTTIADIVVASATGESPEFTVLLAAVQAADPSFIEALSNPDGLYTVFAPTDAAFGALLEALDTSPEELLANTALLNTVLAYHVVPAVFYAEDVVELDGALLGTVLPGAALAISVTDEGVFVNDSAVVAVDVEAANGVVHVIDAVLVPEMGEEEEMMEEEMEEPGTIAEIVVAAATGDAPEFTILLAAVQAADPMVLELLSGSDYGPFTVFAPTDAAFGAALTALGLTAEQILADTDLLTTVLAYHVLPGYFASGDVVGVASMENEEGVTGANVATALPGTTVSVTLSDGSVLVNNATVVTVDIVAANGIIHVIDTVLLPPMGDGM